MAPERIPAFDSLSDVQVLAYLIRLSGEEPVLCPEAAYELLERYGSLPAVFEGQDKSSLELPQLGEQTTLFLQLIHCLLTHSSQPDPDCRLSLFNFSQAQKVISARFRKQKVEHTFILLLNESWELLACLPLAVGDATSVLFSSRQVAELAVTYEAKGVIFAHNHPDDATAFSLPDLLTTWRLSAALHSLGIHLLDHILITRNRAISMALLLPLLHIGESPFALMGAPIPELTKVPELL